MCFSPFEPFVDRLSVVDAGDDLFAAGVGEVALQAMRCVLIVASLELCHFAPIDGESGVIR